MTRPPSALAGPGLLHERQGRHTAGRGEGTLESRVSAMRSSTAQNSGSSAMEVAWPESRSERLRKVAIRRVFTGCVV
ncbi:MAG: hypothetical protein ABS78_22755 [Phenylobacterium sp. SCN 70-31]|nr:MAG: hypothetical protein ABS78_22755 [Phenylobacterium sp. SCN 70-31]